MNRPKAFSLLGVALLMTSCGTRSPSGQQAVNPLVVSENYVRKHHPNALPRELERAWHIEDHGEIWTVELFEQQAVGGGVKMAIRKRDGAVLGSELTQ